MNTYLYQYFSCTEIAILDWRLCQLSNSNIQIRGEKFLLIFCCIFCFSHFFLCKKLTNEQQKLKLYFCSVNNFPSFFCCCCFLVQQKIKRITLFTFFFQFLVFELIISTKISEISRVGAMHTHVQLLQNKTKMKSTTYVAYITLFLNKKIKDLN